MGQCCVNIAKRNLAKFTGFFLCVVVWVSAVFTWVMSNHLKNKRVIQIIKGVNKSANTTCIYTRQESTHHRFSPQNRAQHLLNHAKDSRVSHIAMGMCI